MSDHAVSNARAWLETICEAQSALSQLGDGETERVTFDGEIFDDADELRERIESMPLSVQVRGGWHSPYDRDGFDAKPEEFELLLSTGGPALRIVGKLDRYGQIHGTPDLQWQDWGTPWTDLDDMTADQDEAVSAFAGLFWFGE